ncbi:MAG: response regulator [Polyangiaceae bacterium]
MSSDEKRPLGKIALQRKLVSQADLDAALKAQKRSPSVAPTAPAGAAAAGAAGEGEVDEVQILRGLSEQHGIPGIDLLQIAIVLEQLDTVPREVAETHSILPVLVRGDRMFLAMADPTDKRVVDELEFVTGKKVFSYIAVPATLARTVADAYDARARGDRHYLGPRVPAETLRQLGIEPDPAAQAQDTDAIPPDPPSSRQAVGPAPIVTDEASATASAAAEVSTGDFGELGDEVSSISSLPDDLRQRAVQAADSVTSGAGKLVLIVDDEEEIRKMVKRLLTPHGYRVIEADRGLLALRLVKDHTPDLIVLDAMLP